MKKLPLFIALDLETKSQALNLVKKTSAYVQGYKIGPRLFLPYGVKLIEEIKKENSPQIFLDFKFYDIPSSTLRAVQSAFEIGADFVTVHASVGEESLKMLFDFEQQACQKKKFKILFVSILSSEGSSEENKNKIIQLAHQIYTQGLRGFVCSPMEIKILKKRYKELFLVTPGIRLEGQEKDDQKRVMTAQQALDEGSSCLVMGRSLIFSKDPVQVLKKISQHLG